MDITPVLLHGTGLPSWDGVRDSLLRVLTLVAVFYGLPMAYVTGRYYSLRPFYDRITPDLRITLRTTDLYIPAVQIPWVVAGAIRGTINAGVSILLCLAIVLLWIYGVGLLSRARIVSGKARAVTLLVILPAIYFGIPGGIFLALIGWGYALGGSWLCLPAQVPLLLSIFGVRLLANWACQEQHRTAL